MSADLQITQEDLMGVIPFKQVQGKKVSAFIRVKFLLFLLFQISPPP